MIYKNFNLIENLTKEEIEILQKTSLKFGRMKEIIKKFKTKTLKNNFYINQIENPYKNKSLIGWCALEEEEEIVDLNLYVKRSFRNLKFGSKLIAQAKEFHSKNFPEKLLVCTPWDIVGKRFFQHHKIENKTIVKQKLKNDNKSLK